MPTSSADVRRRARCALAAGLLVGCADRATPTEPPLAAACEGVPVTALSLAPFEGRTLSGADINCFALAGGGREYLIAPQLTGASLPYGGFPFRLGAPPTASGAVTRMQRAPEVSELSSPATVPQFSDSGAEVRLHARLRGEEMQLARVVRTAVRERVQARVSATSAVDTLRTFRVLSTLEEPAAYAVVAARLAFAGTRVLLYLDTLAARSVTSADLTAMGALYDTHLAPVVQRTFGDGSDLDRNGRVIMLLTPTVNGMVRADRCSVSGFVRGFFTSHDLASTEPTSNRGEVFYAYVPDESGRWSCPHTKEDVLANLPPTFMHEYQHMISFGEHVLERGGVTEEPWLNEGLSHLAEEFGSLMYEGRFPAPAGRTQPTQLFPDSAGPYITPNVLYSYRYLAASNVYSLTGCAPGTFCSLAERGGIWLFLRWLVDRSGDATARALVETSRTGRANLEAVTNRSLSALLGDYAIAVSTDSVIGAARPAATSPYRFVSRNLRRLYRGLFELYGVPGGVTRPFPIEPPPLVAGGDVTGTMRPGTFMTFRLSARETAPVRLRYVAVDGTPFPATSGAQVSIVRLP